MNNAIILEKTRSMFFPSHNVISNDPMVFPCGISRSGTTLLSAILDAHSRICMGYEMMIPPTMPKVLHIVALLKKAKAEVEYPRQVSSILKNKGYADLGKWVLRCFRLDIEYQELLAILQSHARNYGNCLQTVQSRLQLIHEIIEHAKRKTNASMGGFKNTSSFFDEYLFAFPASKFIYILRDPRDVFASQKEAGLNTSASTTCRDWKRGIKRFENFSRKHSSICMIVQYEKLVNKPEKMIRLLFEFLDLHLEHSVQNFQYSDARILNSSHPNARNLRKGVFNSSVGKYSKTLSPGEVHTIVNKCGYWMEKYAYC